ncbi:unnamed protein product [Linum tenue]|uniref:Uncharacterized protein n=1 Tax=Linum tenue TaxID=586396 RepID=A0AAV0K5X6_9ROSI|nr:unnamed protein product [Linum tenue]
MWILGWKGQSGFSARSTAEEVTEGIDAAGLTAIVTGATSGIGVDTTRVLALRGAHVVMAVRNVEAGKKLKESILKEIPSAKIDVMQLELSSMASVRKFATEYIDSCLSLNILIYNCYRAYGQSKVANILHAKELARRLKEEGANITANSLHPGEIATNLGRNNGLLNGNNTCSSMSGLHQTFHTVVLLIYVALHPQVKGVSGEFFKNSNISETGTAPAQDEELAKQLWDFSMKLINT